MVVVWNVSGAVGPYSSPWRSIDDQVVRTPRETRMDPAPGREGRADRDGWSEVDCSADEEARRRWRENDERVVNRNVIEARIHRQDFNVIPVVWDINVAVRLQVTVAFRFVAHSLHGVHHIRALREDGIAELLRPHHIVSHRVEHTPGSGIPQCPSRKCPSTDSSIPR